MSSPVFVEGDYIPFEFFVEDANGPLDLTNFQDAELKTDIGTESVGFLVPSLGHCVATRMTPLPKPDGTLSKPYQGRVGLRMEADGDEGHAPTVYGTEDLDITVLPSTRKPTIGQSVDWWYGSFDEDYPVAWVTNGEIIVPCNYFGPSSTDPYNQYTRSGQNAVKDANPAHPWVVDLPFTKRSESQLTLSMTVTGPFTTSRGGAFSLCPYGWDFLVYALPILSGTGWEPVYDRLFPSIAVYAIASQSVTVVVADNREWAVPDGWDEGDEFEVIDAYNGQRALVAYAPIDDISSAGEHVIELTLDRSESTVTVSADGGTETTIGRVDVGGILDAADRVLMWSGDLRGPALPGSESGDPLPRMGWSWS